MKLICLILLLTALNAYGQPLQLLSPTLSLRDANRGDEIDHELGIVIWDQGGYHRFYLEYEKENGIAFRKVEFKSKYKQAYFNYFEATARQINNTEIGYSNDYKWMSYGGSVLKNVIEETSIYANFSINTKYLDFKYQKGEKNWILTWDSQFTKPITKNIIMIGPLKFQPSYTFLVKYYQDSRKKYRQIKFGVTASFVK